MYSMGNELNELIFKDFQNWWESESDNIFDCTCMDVVFQSLAWHVQGASKRPTRWDVFETSCASQSDALTGTVHCNLYDMFTKIQWSNASLVKPLRKRNWQKVFHLSFSLLLLEVCCHHASGSKVEGISSSGMLVSSYYSVILNMKIAELSGNTIIISSSSIWFYLSSEFFGLKCGQGASGPSKQLRVDGPRHRYASNLQDLTGPIHQRDRSTSTLCQVARSDLCEFLVWHLSGQAGSSHATIANKFKLICAVKMHLFDCTP